MKILEILNHIESLSGNAKIAYVQSLKESPVYKVFEQVVHSTYSSELNFYIRPSTFHHNGSDGKITLSQAISTMVDNLSTRKVTGNSATDLYMNISKQLSADDAEVLFRVLNRDLRIGMNTVSLNKCIVKQIPTFGVMLCSKNDPKALAKIVWKDRPFVQEKSDGLRIIVTVDTKGTVTYRTRSGKVLELAHLTGGFSRFKGQSFDGEAMVVGADGQFLDRKTGNGVLNSVQKGNMEEARRVNLVLWDTMNTDKFFSGLDSEAYKDRFARLESIINDLPGCHLQVSYRVDTQEECEKIFQQMLSEGKEGIILKNPNGPYEVKRTPNQIKFKAENDCDLKIVGFVEGTGKYEGSLGAIQLESADGGLSVDVGTGFSDADRQSIWNNRESLVGKIVATQYNEVITSKGKKTKSLFLPVFLEIRDDKTEADIL
jgi:ATP-dependent DNA ligase